jgi:hypothetical protein
MHGQIGSVLDGYLIFLLSLGISIFHAFDNTPVLKLPLRLVRLALLGKFELVVVLKILGVVGE